MEKMYKLYIERYPISLLKNCNYRWSQFGTRSYNDRPNNLSLVCLYLSLHISFLLFGHFFFACHTVWPRIYIVDKSLVWPKKKCPNNKKEIYNDKYKHTRDRLFGLL